MMRIWMRRCRFVSDFLFLLKSGGEWDWIEHGFEQEDDSGELRRPLSAAQKMPPYCHSEGAFGPKNLSLFFSASKVKRRRDSSGQRRPQNDKYLSFPALVEKGRSLCEACPTTASARAGTRENPCRIRGSPGRSPPRLSGSPACLPHRTIFLRRHMRATRFPWPAGAERR